MSREKQIMQRLLTERDVVQMLSRGHTISETADCLHLSNQHVHRVAVKAGCELRWVTPAQNRQLQALL